MKNTIFPEQYQTPRHFLLAYNTTYWAITGRRSHAPLTHSVVCISPKEMCNSGVVCLTPWVFWGMTRLLLVPAHCKWQKRSKCHSSVSLLTALPLILICSTTSATSGWMLPQEAISLSSVSVCCLRVKGHIILKIFLEIRLPQLSKICLILLCFLPSCDRSGSISVCQASVYTSSTLTSHSVGCWASWKRPTLLRCSPQLLLSLSVLRRLCVFQQWARWKSRARPFATYSFSLRSLLGLQRLWK